MMLRRWLCMAICVAAVLGMTAERAVDIDCVENHSACDRWVDSLMNKMTLKQKVGQLFIHTVAPMTNEKNKESIRRAVMDYGIGGLLFSGGEVEKQVCLTNMAQQSAAIPLLVTFDGEWGLSMRLKNAPVFPKNRVLGCIQDDSLIYRYGREVARELREIGVHVNFAPVADIDNNPNNPVINVRSFGSNPQEVARKVSAYVRGLEDGGVLAVCKHFPGHGDTEIDSHLALPVLLFNRARLDSMELLPFRSAIKAGVGGVMVGHLQVPEIDDRPASISGNVIMNLLRNDLGFKGLVFTDALEMKGISSHADDVSAEALMAGNDLLLVPRNLKREMAGVMQALKDGRLKEEDINRKCRKVLTLKYKMGLCKCPVTNEKGIDKRLFTGDVEKLQSQLAKAAVTVVKDSAGILPLDLSMSDNVLLSISESLSQAYPFYRQLDSSFPVKWLHANADSLDVAYGRIRSAQQVVVAIHQENCEKYIPLLEKIASEKPLVLVCFASQSVLSCLGDNVLRNASGIVLAHAGDGDLQRYVADVMVDKSYADGRLSVAVGDAFPDGTGVTIDPDSPKLYRPEDFGMNSLILAKIDSIVAEGMGAQAFPGCHVLVTRKGFPVYNKCFGRFAYDGEREVKENDLYDLASVSKVAGTLLAVMKLYDEGRFGLTDAISKYIPELQGTDKKGITIRDLLFHESGLPAYLPFYQGAIDWKTCKDGLFRKKANASHQLRVDDNLYACTSFSYKKEWMSGVKSEKYCLSFSDALFLNSEYRHEILKQIASASLKGHSYRYSCLNFMLLKELVERVSGSFMEQYLDSVFYRPMGLEHTLYNPLTRFEKTDIAPTSAYDFLRKEALQGYVNDQAAALMGGVSGNAGLFSTAHDLAVIFQMLLDKGVCGNHRYLSRATCDLFLEMKSKGSRRGLGFDKPDKEHEENSPCAPLAPAGVFGHTGFTGTCVWGDLDNDLVFVFLSNRTYPTAFDHKQLIRLNIRSRIQQVIYQSLDK